MSPTNLDVPPPSPQLKKSNSEKPHLSRQGSFKENREIVKRNPYHEKTQSCYSEGLDNLIRKIENLKSKLTPPILNTTSDSAPSVVESLEEIQQLVIDLTPKISTFSPKLQKKSSFSFIFKKSKTILKILNKTENLLIDFFQKPSPIEEVAKKELKVLEGFQSLTDNNSSLNNLINIWSEQVHKAFLVKKILYTSSTLLKEQLKCIKELIDTNQGFKNSVAGIFKEDFDKLLLDDNNHHEIVLRIKKKMLFQSTYPWCTLEGKVFDYAAEFDKEFVISEKLLENKTYLQTAIGKEVEFHFLLDDRKMGIKFLNEIINKPEEVAPYLRNLVKTWAQEVIKSSDYPIHQQIVEEIEVLKQLKDAKSLYYLNLLALSKTDKKSFFSKYLSDTLQEGKKHLQNAQIVTELETYFSTAFAADPQETENLESTLKGLEVLEFIEREIYKLFAIFHNENDEKLSSSLNLDTSKPDPLTFSLELSSENFLDISVVENKLKFEPSIECKRISSKILKHIFFLIQLAAEYLDRDTTDSQNVLLTVLEKIRNHPQFLHHFSSSTYLNIYSSTYEYVKVNYIPKKARENCKLEEILHKIVEEADPKYAKLMMAAHSFSKMTKNILGLLYEFKKTDRGQLNFLRFVVYYLKNDKFSMPIPGTEDFSSLETTLNLILNCSYPNNPIFNTLIEKIKGLKDLFFEKPKIYSEIHDILANRQLDKIDFDDPFLKEVLQTVAKLEDRIEANEPVLIRLHNERPELERDAKLRQVDNTSKLAKLDQDIQSCSNHLNELKKTLSTYKSVLTKLKKETFCYVGEIQFRLLKYLYRLEGNIKVLNKKITECQKKLNLFSNFNDKQIKDLLNDEKTLHALLNTEEKNNELDAEIFQFLRSKLKTGSILDQKSAKNHLKKAFSEEVEIIKTQIKTFSRKEELFTLTKHALRNFIKNPSIVEGKPESTHQELGPYILYFVNFLKSEDFSVMSTIEDCGIKALKTRRIENDIEISKIREDVIEYCRYHHPLFKSTLKTHPLDNVDELPNDTLETWMNVYLSEPYDRFNLGEYNFFSYVSKEISFQTSPIFREFIRRFDIIRNGFIPYTLVISKDHTKTAVKWLIIGIKAWVEGHFDLYNAILASLDDNVSALETENADLQAFLKKSHQILTGHNKIFYRNALKQAYNDFKPTYPIFSLIAGDIAMLEPISDVDEDQKININRLEKLTKIKEQLMKHITVHLSTNQAVKKENHLQTYMEVCFLNFIKNVDDARETVKKKYLDTPYYYVSTEFANLARSL